MFGDGERHVRRTRHVGLGTGAAAIPFLLLLAGVRYEWWEYPEPADVILEPVTVGLALFGLISVGIVWAVRSYLQWKRIRTIARGFGVLPAVVLIAAIAFAAVSPPEVSEFNSAHGIMEDFAVSMLSGKASQVGPTEIGGIEFTTIYVDDERCVYFVDSKRSSMKRVGWVYTAECRQSPEWFQGLDRVGDNWYRFAQGR